MKLRFVTLCLLLVVLCACKDKTNTPIKVEDQVTETGHVDLEVYDFTGFKSFLNREDNNVYVINFWATWCTPCIKELPAFEAINKQYKNKGVQVILVSLDIPEAYNTKLKPFMLKENLKSKVIALDDINATAWMPQINKDWTGSLPATLIYKNNDSKFYEQSLTHNELNEALKLFLNK